MTLPWRKQVMHWMGVHDNTDTLRSLINWLARLERNQDDMAELLEAVKKELAELKDAVLANASAVEQLRAAYEYLRDHPKVVEVIKEDPELAAVAHELDDLTADLAATVAKAGASGGA